MSKCYPEQLGPKFIYTKSTSSIKPHSLGLRSLTSYSNAWCRLKLPHTIVPYSTFIPKRTFLVNVKPKSRIGPHHQDVISVLVGSLLGNGKGERLQNGGVRFTFKQQVKHKEYILWLHDFFYKREYCNNNLPVLYVQRSKISKGYRFDTFSFSSLL